MQLVHTSKVGKESVLSGLTVTRWLGLWKGFFISSYTLYISTQKEKKGCEIISKGGFQERTMIESPESTSALSHDYKFQLLLLPALPTSAYCSVCQRISPRQPKCILPSHVSYFTSFGVLLHAGNPFVQPSPQQAECSRIYYWRLENGASITVIFDMAAMFRQLHTDGGNFGTAVERYQCTSNEGKF